MGSRIMPAMADGRSFTNYVSSGLYNNYLEGKFKTPEDSEYRAFLQKNAKEVEKTINALTVYYVKPPVMPKVKLNVTGDANAKMTDAPVDYNQRILDNSYTDTMSKFQRVQR
ncbi:hypothetical protein PBCVIL52s1_519L [Paramecium bursaria Chlorella virus IL-5-2s1]|nr:hypothetical protein PBCVIL52s1_519L [Paramecium bursaria Chlorella virus IL-5-2s1]